MDVDNGMEIDCGSKGGLGGGDKGGQNGTAVIISTINYLQNKKCLMNIAFSK